MKMTFGKNKQKILMIQDYLNDVGSATYEQIYVHLNDNTYWGVSTGQLRNLLGKNVSKFVKQRQQWRNV
tara:strand:+ start:2974 stop:3180 length:207 start_codon:yes stop_codon:yes gene_type:complete